MAAAGAVALLAIAAAVESVVRDRRLGLGPRLVLAVAVGAFPLSLPRHRLAEDEVGSGPDKALAPEPDLSGIHFHEENAFDQTARRYRIVDGSIVPFTRGAGGKWVPDQK